MDFDSTFYDTLYDRIAAEIEHFYHYTGSYPEYVYLGEESAKLLKKNIIADTGKAKIDMLMGRKVIYVNNDKYHINVG